MRSETTLEQACGLIVDCPHNTAKNSIEVSPYAYAVGTKAISSRRIDFTQARPVDQATYRDWIKRAAPREGDLILCREAPVGPVVRVPGTPRVCLGQRTVLLRPNPEVVDGAYLLYVLSSPLSQQAFLALAEGSTVVHLNVADVRRFSVSLPPLKEQRHVAEILRALDDKIDSNRRLAKVLEDAAASLFRARFVDFVGVEEFEESEIGRIPSGWRAMPFSTAVEINPRVQLAKGTIAPFIEMAAVPPWASRPTIIMTRAYSGGSRFEPGDVLMARITGCIEHGKGAFVDFIDSAASGSTEFLVLRAQPPLSSEVVFFLSRDPRIRAHAIASMSGSSGRQRVATSCFDHLHVAVPPDRESWADVDVLLRVAMAQTRALWQESRVLSLIRDALLPKLISGQIRVPDTSDTAEVIGPVAEEIAAADP